MGQRKEMASNSGVGYGKHRRADAQTPCYSAGSSNSAHHRTETLFITGDKTRDAALGEPRIKAGEIIGWRFWGLRYGFLHSLIASHVWRPGVLERASCNECGPHNLGYHAFKDREQAELYAPRRICDWVVVIGSVAMWGEVIEHQYGWRSEYASVRSIIGIAGDIGGWSKQRLLLDLSEKYGCMVMTTL